MVEELLKNPYFMGAVISLELIALYYLIKSIIRKATDIHKIKTGAGLYSALRKVQSEKVCPDFHNWDKTMLAFPQIEVDYHLVCTTCGQICNTQWQLNDAAMEVFQNNLKLKAEREEAKKKIMARFSEIVRADRNMWIKTNIGRFKKHDSDVERLLQDFHDFALQSMQEATIKATNELTPRNG